MISFAIHGFLNGCSQVGCSQHPRQVLMLLINIFGKVTKFMFRFLKIFYIQCLDISTWEPRPYMLECISLFHQTFNFAQPSLCVFFRLGDLRLRSSSVISSILRVSPSTKAFTFWALRYFNSASNFNSFVEEFYHLCTVETVLFALWNTICSYFKILSIVRPESSRNWSLLVFSILELIGFLVSLYVSQFRILPPSCK